MRNAARQTVDQKTRPTTERALMTRGTPCSDVVWAKCFSSSWCWRPPAAPCWGSRRRWDDDDDADGAAWSARDSLRSRSETSLSTEDMAARSLPNASRENHARRNIISLWNTAENNHGIVSGGGGGQEIFHAVFRAKNVHEIWQHYAQSIQTRRTNERMTIERCCRKEDTRQTPNSSICAGLNRRRRFDWLMAVAHLK